MLGLKNLKNGHSGYNGYNGHTIDFVGLAAAPGLNLTGAAGGSGSVQFLNFYDDISKWDVSNVTDMSYMFFQSTFNGNISAWNVSSVANMNGMFNEAKNFAGDVSKWNVNQVRSNIMAFDGCPIPNKYKPRGGNMNKSTRTNNGRNSSSGRKWWGRK